MRHLADAQFWAAYDRLPSHVQKAADESFSLLKSDPRHPSLQFKKVGRFVSARVGRHYRAVAVQRGSDVVWIWIGLHDMYERKIQF